jgi:hypothetical protein
VETDGWLRCSQESGTAPYRDQDELSLRVISLTYTLMQHFSAVVPWEMVACSVNRASPLTATFTERWEFVQQC